MRRVGILSVVIASATLTACTPFTGPDNQRVVGIIEWMAPSSSVAPQGQAGASFAPDGYEEPPVLEAPDTVAAGVPFEVVVRTWGSNGCWREAGAKVSAAGMTIAITPYDRHEVKAGYMCTMAIVRLPRTLRVSFPQPGEGVIRVTGRRVLNSTGSESREEPMSIEQRVIVR